MDFFQVCKLSHWNVSGWGTGDDFEISVPWKHGDFRNRTDIPPGQLWATRQQEPLSSSSQVEWVFSGINTHRYLLSLSQLVRDVKAGEKESEERSLGLEPAFGYLWVEGKFLPERAPRNSFSLHSDRAGCLQLLNVMGKVKFCNRKWGAVAEGEWRLGPLLRGKAVQMGLS